MKAIALLSGGLDSTVATTLATKQHGPEDVLALSFDYGQKHYAEIHHANQVALMLGCPHRVIQLPHIFGSSSTVVAGGPPQPHLTYKQIAEDEGPSPTVVPYRNGTLLSVAAVVAVVEGANWIYAGMHAEDARNWAYPDCTPEFLGAMSNAIRVGTYDQVRLITPLQWMMKKDVVKLGAELDAPFGFTLSCYDGRDPACGVCPTCVERKAAFEAANLTDPIAYAI